MKQPVKTFVCANGSVLRPVRQRDGWRYQVFHPARGLLRIHSLLRTQQANELEIEAIAKGMGGGRWV